MAGPIWFGDSGIWLFGRLYNWPGAGPFLHNSTGKTLFMVVIIKQEVDGARDQRTITLKSYLSCEENKIKVVTEKYIQMSGKKNDDMFLIIKFSVVNSFRNQM